MAPTEKSDMASGRGIITDGEYSYLRGEDSQQREYEARSRVRARIKEVVADDIAFLEEHHPDLLEELREVVCDSE